ncbi:MAG: hypothetical protein ACK4N5_16410, partial [Myxococcales bacterium]
VPVARNTPAPTDPTLPPRYPAFRRDLQEPQSEAGVDDDLNAPTMLRDELQLPPPPPPKKRTVQRPAAPAPAPRPALDDEDQEDATQSNLPAVKARPRQAPAAPAPAPAPEAPPKKSGGSGVIIALLLLIILGGAGWYFVAGPGKGTLQKLGGPELESLVNSATGEKPPAPAAAAGEPGENAPAQAAAQPPAPEGVDDGFAAEKRRAEEDRRRAAEEQARAQAEADARAADEARKAEEARKEEERKLAEAAAAAKKKAPEKDKKKVEPAVAKAPVETTSAEPKPEAPAKKFGAMLIRAKPVGQLRYNGAAIAGAKVELTSANGVIEVAGEGVPFKVKLSYDGQTVQVASEPWSIVYVNDVSKGRTPLGGVKLGDDTVRMELKNPSVEQPLELVLKFVKP